MNEVVIVQRQTLDWAGMDTATYRTASVPFCRLWGKPDDYMQHLVNLWNRTFGHDYFTLREQLKQLASRHNAGLSGCRFIAFDGYRTIPDDGLAYVFVDDDDWLAPQLADTLRHSTLDQHDAGIWKACTLGGPRSAYPLFFWGANGRCMTNNYTVSGRWLQAGGRLQEVCQHADAYHRLPDLDVLPIDAWLSITSKSPCSSVSLAQTLGGRHEGALLAAAVAEYNTKLAGLKEADFERAPWAWPLFVATRQLFLEVAGSRS